MKELYFIYQPMCLKNRILETNVCSCPTNLGLDTPYDVIITYNTSLEYAVMLFTPKRRR